MRKKNRNEKPNLLKKIELKLALTFLFLTLAIEFYFSFFSYRTSFNSDSAAWSLLAKEMLRTGSMFPNSWIYANGDIFTFGPHLIMWVLGFFMMNQLLVHSIAVYLMYLGLNATVYFFLRVNGFTRVSSIIAVSSLSNLVILSVKEPLYSQ